MKQQNLTLDMEAEKHLEKELFQLIVSDEWLLARWGVMEKCPGKGKSAYRQKCSGAWEIAV